MSELPNKDEMKKSADKKLFYISKCKECGEYQLIVGKESYLRICKSCFSTDVIPVISFMLFEEEK